MIKRYSELHLAVTAEQANRRAIKIYGLLLIPEVSVLLPRKGNV